MPTKTKNESNFENIDIVPLTPSKRRFYGMGIPGVDLSMLNGKLIVVEGADGSGRSTQIAKLVEWLEGSGHATVQVERLGDAFVRTWLQGGSMRDKTTYAACMQQLWGVIDNPRYLLMPGHGGSGECYGVPEVFGRQKESAAVLEQQMRKVLGPSFHLVYTRTPQGRQMLLWARTQSLINRNQEVWQRRKVAKGVYE